jgi:hypothetical protein
MAVITKQATTLRDGPELRYTGDDSGPQAAARPRAALDGRS